MASRYNQLTMFYIFNILKLDASPKKPYSAPMVHRRLKELGINLDRKTVFNHMKILTEQMLSADQDEESFFRQYLCSRLFRCRKEEGKKAGKMAESPEMKVVTGSVCRKKKLRMSEEPRKPMPDQLLPYFRDAAHEVFQASEYRNDHPVMYSDETVRIHLSCDPVILNNLVDDFGWSIQTRDIKDPDHPDWAHVTAKASLMGAAVFCTHHCRHCKVISPQKLREKVVENLKAGLALYE